VEISGSSIEARTVRFTHLTADLKKKSWHLNDNDRLTSKCLDVLKGFIILSRGSNARLFRCLEFSLDSSSSVFGLGGITGWSRSGVYL